MTQANTPPDLSTEQVKVASSPGQTQRVSGETDPVAAAETDPVAAAEAVYEMILK